MKMKRCLAFLLAIFMIVPLFAQGIVFAGAELSYTKSTQAYTVAGKSYYKASLTNNYNGVDAGTEFFVDASGNVIVDTYLLGKLNTIDRVATRNIVELLKESIDVIYFSGRPQNIANAAYKFVLGGEIESFIGKTAFSSVKTFFDMVSAANEGNLFDFLKDGCNFAIDTYINSAQAVAIIASSGATYAVAYANIFKIYASKVAKYPSKIYDYEQLENFYAEQAIAAASSFMATKFANACMEPMLKEGASFSEVMYEKFSDSAAESVFSILNEEIMKLSNEEVANFFGKVSCLSDLFDLAQTKLCDNGSSIYTSKYTETMSNFYRLLSLSDGMKDIHSKLSAKQSPSLTYTIGVYTPSEYNGLNIRSGASTSNSIVGAIAQGMNFTVTDISGIWGYTTCNGVSGWVCLDYAAKVAASGNADSFENTYNNTGNQRNDILGVAYTQIGYKEDASGYNKYAQSTAEWCAYFVLWCAEQAGISSSIIPRYAGCRELYNGVISCGGKVVTEPIAGDLIFYRCTKCPVNGYSDAYSHVGIAFDSTYSIEGNIRGQVGRFISANYGDEPHYVSTGDVKIIYVRPNYKNDTTPSSKLSAPKITSSSTFTSDKNVVLSWELDGADYYGITVVNDQTNAVVFDGDISESSLDLGKLSAGKYRWQVRGYNGAGWGGLTDLTYFTVEGSSDTVTGEFYSSWKDLPINKSDTYYKYYFDSTVNPYFPNNAPYSPNYPNEYGKDSDNEYVYGNCTWYCWSRASEILVQNGKSPLSKTQLLSNPAGWFSCAGGLRIDRSANAQPKTNSIAVYQIGNEEHVRYIDYADENTVIYSESGYRDTNDIDQDLNIVDPFNGGVPTWLCFKSGTATKSSGKWVDNGPWKYGFTVGTNGLLGYIYLDVGENVTPPTVEKLVSTASKSTYTTDENVVIDWNSFAGATSYGLTVTKKTGNSWTSRDIVYDKNGLIGTSVNLGKFDIGEYRFKMGAYDSDGTLLGQYSVLSYFTVKTTTASDDFEWSEWSDWSTEKPAESDLVEVESKTQYGYYHYILQYSDGKCGAYPIDSATFNSIFPSYPTTQKDYHTKYFDTQLSKTETLTYDKAYDCYINNCCPDAYDYDNGSNASYFYYLETRTVYRSRTKITNTIPVTGVFLNKSSVSLNVGDTETLVAAIMPSDATNRAVTWSSSDPSVAKVRNGVITALSAGTTEITVTTEDGNKISTCTVNVTPSVSSIKAVMSSATASHGDTVVLTVTLEGAPLTDALGFKLELPEGITLAEGENTCWKIEGYVMDINISKLQGVWGGTEDADLNGEVLSLEFKVEETAASGANEINFEFYPNDEESSKTSEAAVESAGVIYVCDHDYGDLWISDGIQHWHECAICGERSDVDVHNMEQGVCTECGKVFYVIGDVDGKEGVYASDAIYLLYNIFFGEDKYPVNQNCDFDGNGEVEAADAIYLLYHVFFSEEYPLN